MGAACDWPALVQAILAGYALPADGDHGVGHWVRVWETGLRLAARTGADPEVVRLFALCHDARRINQHRDPGHGRRGAEFAEALRGTLIRLDDGRFARFREACVRHTDGLRTGDPTVLACWDADRLDLGRVGIVPDPGRLCTDAARGLLGWADARALAGQASAAVLAEWGLAGAGRRTQRR